MKDFLIEVHDLKKYFELKRDIVERITAKPKRFVRAVDGITFSINRGEVFGLAGESGSGKTTTGKLILNIYPPTGGDVLFDGAALAALPKREMKPLRKRMQVIFQDPYASLNPRMKIGKAVAQPLEIHGIGTPPERKQKVLKILERVGLIPPISFYAKYPHQLSGGQRQRVVIARALVLKPDFVVADEPIAMADVSMRVLLLELMSDLKKDFNLTYLFITHDLATAKYICDRIAVMYLGRIAEMGPIRDVYGSPFHPYTKALLAAVPVPDPAARRSSPIPRGEIPDPVDPPPGCRFHPRCPARMHKCDCEIPEMREPSPGHKVACFLY